MAFANRGWMVFAIMPIFALAGIGTPAFQALATRQVDPARQGQLQGVLASAVSLASIVAPLAFSTFYLVVQSEWPGAVWLTVVVLYVVAVPLVFLGIRTAPTQPACALSHGAAEDKETLMMAIRFSDDVARGPAGH